MPKKFGTVLEVSNFLRYFVKIKFINRKKHTVKNWKDKSDEELLKGVMSGVGHRIMLNRKKLNLSQKELGQAVGLSKPTISRMEAGESGLNKSLISVMRFIGMNPNLIYSGWSVMEESTLENVGFLIAMARNCMGLTQMELAEACDLNNVTMSSIESLSESNTTAENVETICDTLNQIAKERVGRDIIKLAIQNRGSENKFSLALIRDVISERRTEIGMSRKTLEEERGVSESNLARFQTNASGTRKNSLHEILTGLEITYKIKLCY